jgi:hypothetical protein
MTRTQSRWFAGLKLTAAALHLRVAQKPDDHYLEYLATLWAPRSLVVITTPFHRARFPYALRPCLICNFP